MKNRKSKTRATGIANPCPRYRKSIIRSCDKLWEYLVKNRAGWRCEMCGSSSNGLHAAHIIGRRGLWTRWRLRNGLGLCVNCHDDVKIKDWLITNRPRRWRWVMKQKNIIHRGGGLDLKNEYRRLRRTG